MAPVRQVTDRQLDILVEFAEENKDIAVKLHRYGLLSQQRANKAWERLAQMLNSIGEGSIKSAIKWKRYWHLLKCRTKAKAADVRRSQSGIGGEPNKIVPLTEVEQRIVRIIGKVAVMEPRQRPHTSSISHIGKMAVMEPRQRPHTSSISPIKKMAVMEPWQRPHTSSIGPIGKVAVMEQQQRPHTSSIGPTRIAKDVPNREEQNVPHWLHALEERHIAIEERLTSAVESLSATNEGLLISLQQMAGTQVQLVNLLQKHLNPSSNSKS